MTKPNRRHRLTSVSYVRALPALAAVAALVAWSGLSVANALGSGGGDPSAASDASQYQYSGKVTGGGTIAGPGNGHVSFSLNARLDSTGGSGSCNVIEPSTKTKVNCLGVTSIVLSTEGNGCSSAVISGPATVNGAPTTYQITAIDCGSPGSNDSFSIQADGFTRSGVVSGNITIHGFGG